MGRSRKIRYIPGTNRFCRLGKRSFTSLWIIADKLKEGFYWQTFHCNNLCFLVIGVLLFKNIIAALICFTIGKCLAYGVNFLYLEFRQRKLAKIIENEKTAIIKKK